MNGYFFLSLIFFAICILESSYKTKHIFNALFNTFLILLYLTITIIYFSADYFTGVGINEAVLFTMESGLGDAGFGEYLLLATIVSICFVCALTASYFYFRVVKNCMYLKPKRLQGVIHNVFLLLAFMSHPFVLDLYNIIESRYMPQSIDFNKYYKKPTVSSQKTNGMNLVYIYAESLEKTYFDESLFPGLMKNIKELKKKSTEFTDIQQVPGVGWTIAGMTASQCGIPLFTVSGENSILQTVPDENNIKGLAKKKKTKFLTRDTGENSMGNMDTFLRGATCLGDVFSTLGYHLVYMQGASIGFSGKNKFYGTHSFNEVFGRDKLIGRLEDSSYKNGWGLYDDSLLPMVYDKFIELSKKGNKFALFALTLDTHPYEAASRSCKGIPYGDGDNSILNSAHCSDKLIADFIKKIQKSKYGKDTIIILTSDHLAMRNSATEFLLQKERKDLFLIFDPRTNKYIEIDKKGSMFDVGPTILHTLDINTDLGLGRNLFIDTSLYASFKNFNKKLLSWRDSILSLWKFPKLPESYSISISDRKVHIGDNSYKYPVLFKITNNKELHPIFEVSTPKKLYMYLPEFKSMEKFIWIDRCIKQKKILDVNVSGRFCATQGTLATTLVSKNLNNQITEVKTKQLYRIEKANIPLYQNRLSNIPKWKKIVKGIKPRKGELWVRSSSWPTFSCLPSTIRTADAKLPLSRGLNIVTLDENGKFTTKKFDVFGSKISANNFLKTIKQLIKQKKFWIIVAHDAVNNTYQGYKRSLKDIGFKLLPTINFRVAYIAYSDKNGKIHEFSDKDTTCKIIDSFVL